MSVARFTFGPRLKAHRERQGITLQDIADSTKISIALLAGLERNDLSQWPKGIFRRAFLRSYARAINIPFEATWAEFSQLFPEDGSVPASARLADPTELRLTLAASTRLLLPPTPGNVAAAAGDLGVAVGLGVVVSVLTGFSAWMSIAVSALVCSAACTALVGGSLTQHLIRASRTRQPMTPRDHAPVLGDERAGTPAMPLSFDDGRADVLEVESLPPRPRIVAVPSNRGPSQEVRERRVADR